MSQSESKQQEEREREGGGGRWGRTELRREGKGGQETANETDAENRSFNASAKQMTVNGKTMKIMSCFLLAAHRGGPDGRAPYRPPRGAAEPETDTAGSCLRGDRGDR